MSGQRPSLLILGASGLLGMAVSKEAASRGDWDLHLSAFRGSVDENLDARYHRADLRNQDAVGQLLKAVLPDVVINCAGIVKSTTASAVDSSLLDTVLPHLVANLLDLRGGRLLQISTDCVFSGRRGGYSEEDLPDPIDLYGRFKLAGEVYDKPHLTVRTSFIGLELPPAKGLLGWFLEQKGEVPGYRNWRWSGLTTTVLAKVLLELASRQDVSGLLHIAGESLDKARLLKTVAMVFNKVDTVVHEVDHPACDRTLCSVRSVGLSENIPSIRTMLEQLAREQVVLSPHPGSSGHESLK